jgi:hypothetical protein
MKFWIGIGVATIMAVIFITVVVLPAARENNDRFDLLQERVEKLERYAREKVKNERWIEQEREKHRRLQEQLENLREELLERDGLLEKHFGDTAGGEEEEGPLEFGRFIVVYEDRMKELKKKLENSVEVIDSDRPLVEAELGNTWQPAARLHEYEKQYWIQEAVVNAISRANAGGGNIIIPVFISFQFIESPGRYLCPIHEDDEMFDVHPFELKVALKFQYVPELLQELLAMPLGCEITSLRFARYEKLSVGGSSDSDGGRRSERSGRRPSGVESEYGWSQEPSMEKMENAEEAEAEDSEEMAKTERLPDEMIELSVQGYVPDYIAPSEEQERSRTGTGHAEPVSRRQAK